MRIRAIGPESKRVIIPFLVFWILLIWSLFDGDLSPKEGAMFIGVWIVLLLCFTQFDVSPFWFVVPTVVLDIILIFKIFGGDIQIR